MSTEHSCQDPGKAARVHSHSYKPAVIAMSILFDLGNICYGRKWISIVIKDAGFYKGRGNFGADMNIGGGGGALCPGCINCIFGLKLKEKHANT